MSFRKKILKKSVPLILTLAGKDPMNSVQGARLARLPSSFLARSDDVSSLPVKRALQSCRDREGIQKRIFKTRQPMQRFLCQENGETIDLLV